GRHRDLPPLRPAVRGSPVTDVAGFEHDAIRLEGVGKRYSQLEERTMLLRSLMPFAKKTRTPFWAVRDVNLRVGMGETLGLIGRNGAGKTTLLRMLAGVSMPTEGTLTVNGSIAPLISVGVGFNA